MTKYVLLFAALCGSSSCELPPRSPISSSDHFLTPEPGNGKKEEYVMITTAVGMPLYVNHDEAAFRRWGAARAVKVSILGPQDWDVNEQLSTIEAVIGTRPSGLLINGTDPALAAAINKAVAAGIPTIVYDSDIPHCNRDAFLGTDWTELGKMQGRAMANLLGGKGKIACLGILGQTNEEAGFKGLMEVMKEFPGIEVVGKFDDKANAEEATRLASDIISAHPDISGFCGFDSNSGPGIGLAVGEAGKTGKIMITTVDWEPEHLRLVKQGVIQLLIGQKRELFTWYGAQFLYDRVHHTNRLSLNDAASGISDIPFEVNTGLLIITKDNIDEFLK